MWKAFYGRPVRVHSPSTFFVKMRTTYRILFSDRVDPWICLTYFAVNVTRFGPTHHKILKVEAMCTNMDYYRVNYNYQYKAVDLLDD